MEIRKIAKLAHLEISDAEVELYTPQMQDIVAYVEQLNELDTANIDPMVGGLTAEGESTITAREDLPAASLGRDAALGQASSAVEGHFQVPKVL